MFDKVEKYLLALAAAATLGLFAFGVFRADITDNIQTSTAQVVKIVNPKTGALGSGVVVQRDGLIITNAHVVSDTEEVQVTFSDGASFVGKVANRTEAELDTATVKVDRYPGFRGIAAIRCEPLKVGEEVYAIGHPLGRLWTVTFGRVSAVRGASVQLDATILPGNSGGGLFDKSGRLVGLPNKLALMPLGPFAASATGQTFAVSGPALCMILGKK